ILRLVVNLADVETTRGLTDAQLLERFAERREQAAFAALVQRHGGLGWGVCKHMLRQEQDVEDAFQATLPVLAPRARHHRKTDAGGSFLHGVAYRVAVKARLGAHRRAARERAAARPQAQTPADLGWRELQAALDEEVQRLPERYRGPFVLCCLEGKSREDVARELGCKEGTLASRLARARALLQRRLSHRGVTLSAGLCAGALWGHSAPAEVPAELARSTVHAAIGVVGEATEAAVRLAEGVAGA